MGKLQENLRVAGHVSRGSDERSQEINEYNVHWETQRNILDSDFADYRSWVIEETASAEGLLYEPQPLTADNAETFAMGADEEDNEDDGSESTESENGDELTADSFRSADAGAASGISPLHRLYRVYRRQLPHSCYRAPRTEERRQRRGPVADTLPLPGPLQGPGRIKSDLPNIELHRLHGRELTLPGKGRRNVLPLLRDPDLW